VIVRIGHTTYRAVLDQSGQALVGVPGLPAGRYAVRVTYPGRGLHAETTMRASLRVLAARHNKPPAGTGAPRPVR
jgi:hypothetical protein